MVRSLLDMCDSGGGRLFGVEPIVALAVARAASHLAEVDLTSAAANAVGVGVAAFRAGIAVEMIIARASYALPRSDFTFAVASRAGFEPMDFALAFAVRASDFGQGRCGGWPSGMSLVDGGFSSMCSQR